MVSSSTWTLCSPRVFIHSVLALSLLAFFKSAAALGPAPVALGSAGKFAILAKSGISTVPSSAITGDIGVSPASGTALTGFSLMRNTGASFATSLQVTGRLFAADFARPTHANLISAVFSMQTAFSDASGRMNPNFLNPGDGSLAGLNLVPGLYKWTTAVSIPTDVTITGTANDTWIFQVAGGLTMAAAQQITLAGGATATNIVWVVSGGVAIGVGAHFEGVLLGAKAITLDTGASTNGRLLSQTAVVLQMATVIQPLV